MDSVFEKAVLDFYKGQSSGKLLIHNTYGEPDEMPLDVYFRKESELSDLELYALELCSGNVLDVGAATGAITQILEERGVSVDALEISTTFCSIMQEEGLKSVINEDFLLRDIPQKYDTLLMMMNGFGLCGSIDRLPELFSAIDRHLAVDGQVIFDSSDLDYLYEGDKPDDKYYGEMDYRYEYNGELGDWFKWLYIDSETLAREAGKYGFELQVLYIEETDQYLGRMTRE